MNKKIDGIMNKENALVLSTDKIKSRIYTLRNQQVMLDSDLANLYFVTTKVLNQAVKRNIERFPKEFMFQLTKSERNELVTNCDRLKNLKFSSTNPFVFTEQGVAMLSGVLKSETAIKVSIQIMNAFVSMKKFINSNALIFQRLDKVEIKQLEHDKKFNEIFDAIQSKDIKPEKGIFFDGQIFDAYKFVSDLIKSANKSIILIDNFVDDSVLTLFSKRKNNVGVKIFTKNISKQLQLDLTKYNLQYPLIEIKEFKQSHDRFMIMDNKEVYHFGASLKDLGKSWFAFSKFDKDAFKILNKLNER